MPNINTLTAFNCGGSIYRKLSTGDTNAASIKGFAGNLFSLMASNSASSDRFIKLYNKSTAPIVGTDTPVMTFPIAASTKTVVELLWHDFGIYFSNGIAIAITGALADTDTTAILANEVVINAIYM